MSRTDITPSIFGEMKREVFLVTSQHAGHKSGMIITWVTPASLIPERKRIVMALSPYNHTTQTLLQSGRFIIHLLAKEQALLAHTFGTYHSNQVDKFGEIAFTVDEETGIPIISTACGWERGRVVSQMDVVDRLVVVADLDESSFDADKQPLLVGDLEPSLPTEITQKMNAKYLHDIDRDRELISAIG